MVVVVVVIVMVVRSSGGDSGGDGGAWVQPKHIPLQNDDKQQSATTPTDVLAKARIDFECRWNHSGSK